MINVYFMLLFYRVKSHLEKWTYFVVTVDALKKSDFLFPVHAQKNYDWLAISSLPRPFLEEFPLGFW